MKLCSSTTLVLATALTATVQAWDKDDHEIFRLRDELEKVEGLGTTFYDFLEISRSAKQLDIDKAFRKRSRALHPDKARQALIASRAAAKPQQTPGAVPSAHVNKPPTQKEIKAAEKLASERFTRLGLIAEILKDDRRKSYDHFLDNGFPKWRGTGYYYERFRPGLFSTLLGLFIFSGGLLHWIVLQIGYRQQREFVQRYIQRARESAWGKDSAGAGIPGLDDTAIGNGVATEEAPQTESVNRRDRRAQEKEAKKKNKEKTLKPGRGKAQSGSTTPLEETGSGSSTPVPGARRRVEAENGKTLVVDSVGNVFLEEEDEETEETNLLLLDPNEIEKPTFRQTFLYRLPAWAFNTVKDSVTGGKHIEAEVVAPEILVANGGAAAKSSEILEASTSRQRKRKGRK